MGIIDDILKRLEPDVETIGREKAEIDAALKDKTAERKRVAELPCPQEEAAEKMAASIDHMGAEAREHLQMQYSSIRERYTGSNIGNVLQSHGAGFTKEVNPRNFFYLLREPLKKAIREEVMEWDWPKEVGLPEAERVKALAKLDKEIEQLKKKQKAYAEKADRIATRLRGLQ